MGLDSSEAIAFVNSNRNEPVEIEKKMENPSDAEFTMVLEQVLSTSAEQVNTPEDIRETRPGAAIEYTVHSSDNDMQIGTGITGKNGEINLKAGQYARLELPDGTLWTVREEQKPDHVLKELTGTPDEKVKLLADNLMLIQQKAEVVGILDIQVKNPYIGMNEVITKDNFIVTAAFSDGSTKILTPQDYTLTPDKAAATPGPMEVVIQWTEGKLEGTAVLSVTGEREITKEMVESGVINGATGEQVTLKEGQVVIPETIIWDGGMYTVIGIAKEAFKGNTDITAIEFPKTLKNIGQYAFSGCSSLAGELEIPSGVITIGGHAFENCSNLTGELKIPDEVTAIGADAFLNCKGFTGGLKIPEKITKIESGTFEGCSGFDGELTIPESVTTIGGGAFRGCKNLTGELKLHDGITSIGNYAFEDCSGFKGELRIPSGLTVINQTAFEGCSGFTGTLVIPANITEIGPSAFRGCSGFETLILEEGVTSIGGNAFSYCKFKGDLTIPGTVTTIGYEAFSWGEFGGTLTISDGVTTIGKSAFLSCEFTGDLKIPDSVTTIGDSTFQGCGFSGSLTLSQNLTEIPDQAFMFARD